MKRLPAFWLVVVALSSCSMLGNNHIEYEQLQGKWMLIEEYDVESRGLQPVDSDVTIEFSADGTFIAHGFCESEVVGRYNSSDGWLDYQCPEDKVHILGLAGNPLRIENSFVVLYAFVIGGSSYPLQKFQKV